MCVIQYIWNLGPSGPKLLGQAGLDSNMHAHTVRGRCVRALGYEQSDSRSKDTGSMLSAP